MCWSSHREIRDSWVMERRPRADVRVSDADRQETIDQLSRHTGEGRLTLEEFEARVDEALQSKTQAELQQVMRELPTTRTPLRRTFPDWKIRAGVVWTIIIVAAAVAIGPGLLWWLIPLAWFKLGGFGHHHRHHDHPEASRDDELTLA